MMVDVYDGATPLGSVAAGAFRAEVGAAIGDKGFHAFSFATPVGVKDGKTHTIMVRPAGSAAALDRVRSLTCAQ